jgi:hypothetical protein
MADATHSSFWQYFFIVVHRAFKEFAWGRDVLIATCLAVATLVIQVVGRVISVQDWQQHKTLWIVSIVGPYIVVLTLHIGWKMLTASWRAYQEKETELAILAAKSVAQEERIKQLSSVAPVIEISFGPLIPKGKLGEKPIELFVCCTLTLKEPAEVQITSFELSAVLYPSIPVNASWISDTEEWVRVIETNDQSPYKAMLYPSSPKCLVQRGDPIECGLHFSLDMRESDIQASQLILRVVTPHGTCTQTVSGNHAFPDKKGKGMMMRRDSGFVRQLWPSLGLGGGSQQPHPGIAEKNID